MAVGLVGLFGLNTVTGAWNLWDSRHDSPGRARRFISGRATRSMDRFAVKRDGANIAVDLDRLFRQDQNGADWDAAFLSL